MTTTQTGKIKNWKDDRGFGFIIPDGGGENLFFHVSSLQSADMTRLELGPGVRVEFVPCSDNSGRPKAVSVKLASMPTHRPQEFKRASLG